MKTFVFVLSLLAWFALHEMDIVAAAASVTLAQQQKGYVSDGFVTTYHGSMPVCPGCSADVRNECAMLCPECEITCDLARCYCSIPYGDCPFNATWRADWPGLQRCMYQQEQLCVQCTSMECFSGCSGTPQYPICQCDKGLAALGDGAMWCGPGYNWSNSWVAAPGGYCGHLL